MPLRKIISGGQTAVDRAALDAALTCGLAIGGAIPAERHAEDGQVPADYAALTEVSADDERAIDPADITRYYPNVRPGEHHRCRSRLARTRRNVLDAQATLIIARGPLTGGTRATRDYAKRAARPLLIVDLAHETDSEWLVVGWLRENGIETLNVAGPSESEFPGIYRAAKQLLASALRAL